MANGCAEARYLFIRRDLKAVMVRWCAMAVRWLLDGVFGWGLGLGAGGLAAAHGRFMRVGDQTEKPTTPWYDHLLTLEPRNDRLEHGYVYLGTPPKVGITVGCLDYENKIFRRAQMTHRRFERRRRRATLVYD